MAISDVQIERFQAGVALPAAACLLLYVPIEMGSL